MTAVRRRHRQARQGGFSLLEVLVAFSILALSLGVLMQIFSKAMTATALGAGYDRAAAVAEMRLQTVGREVPLEAGVYQGETDDGLAWTVLVGEDEGARETGIEMPWALHPVAVEVLWRDGGGAVRRVRLATMRFGMPPQ